ncbi:MAG: hypothetical protein L0219_19010, partial [Phycisphaerales bacterium]|nr:hypothetical protein [Phycisphaerales bacterium]
MPATVREIDSLCTVFPRQVCGGKSIECTGTVTYLAACTDRRRAGRAAGDRAVDSGEPEDAGGDGRVAGKRSWNADERRLEGMNADAAQRRRAIATRTGAGVTS